MGNFGESVVTIATTIVFVAILAVLVSKRAQTPQVISSAGRAFSSALRTATSPVTGNHVIGPDMGYGFGGGFNGGLG